MINARIFESIATVDDRLFIMELQTIPNIVEI